MQYLPAPRTITQRIRENKTWLGLAAVIGVLALFAILRIVTAPKPSAAVGAEAHTVTVASVAELSKGGAPLRAVGTVSSVNRAELHTKKGGSVTAAYVKAGDFVGAGQTLATLENAAERAALASAKARISGAQAAYDKVQKGTREEQLAILESSVQSAQNTAKTALASAYGAVDNAVLHGTDTFLTDPRGINPQFSLPTSDFSAAVKVGSGRFAMQALLNKYQKLEQSPTVADTTTLATTQAEVMQVIRYIDDVLSALNKTLPSTSLPASTIAGYTASTQGTRAALLGASSALSGAQTAIEVAAKNKEQGVKGAVAEDVSAAKAQLDDAEAGYQASLAQYNNSLVIAPIGGTLASFSLRSGDYVSPNQSVGSIENPQALEVIAFIAPSDKARALVGAKATINDEFDGVVTSVAPGVDTARGGIEMHIRIKSTPQSEDLSNGSTVSISIQGVTDKSVKKTIALPVSAIKLTSEGAFVFTVASGTLTAIPVTVGSIVGQDIVVTKGVTGDMKIVTDARGLNEGDVVTVAK